MFALVLWTRGVPRTSSVIPYHRIKKYASGRTVAKWDARLHDIRVLQTSRDIQYLEALKVSTEGEVFSAQEVTVVDEDGTLKLVVNRSESPHSETSELERPPEMNEDDSDSDSVELTPESGVFIRGSSLTVIRHRWANNARQLSRRLLREIIGKENLKTMTPTGKGEFPAIPKHVRDAVEEFVNANVPPSTRLKHTEYIRVLTAMCNGLRNPKPYVK